MPSAASKKPRRDRYTGPIKLEDTKMETIERKTNVPKVDLRDYIEGLKASKTSGQSVGHTIVEASVNILKSRYRQAAGQLGYGVSFTLIPAGSELATERGYQLADGDARLLVTAGEKQVRAPKPPEGSTEGSSEGSSEGASGAPEGAEGPQDASQNGPASGPSPEEQAETAEVVTASSG